MSVTKEKRVSFFEKKLREIEDLHGGSLPDGAMVKVGKKYHVRRETPSFIALIVANERVLGCRLPLIGSLADSASWSSVK